MWIYMGYNFTSKLVLSQETVTKSYAVNPLVAASSLCVSSMQSLRMEKLATTMEQIDVNKVEHYHKDQ